MKKYHVAIFVTILSMSSLSALAKDILPDGWVKAGMSPNDYTIGIDENISFDNDKSVFIEGNNPETTGHVSLTQVSTVEDYLGQRVQFTFNIKSQDVSGWSGGWFRVDGDPKEILAFDNMGNRPIKETTDWAEYSIVLDVPKDAKKMLYGVILKGTGKVWFDNLNFKIVDESSPVTGTYTYTSKAKNLSFENNK